MALTEKNQLLIAFKKLYGKSHTNVKFGIFNESVASNVQLGIDKIFSNSIPVSPNSPLYSITNGVAEKIKFSLVGIPLSTYANTLGALAGTTIDDEGDTTVNGVHAYKLVLPNNYQSLSSNIKSGTAPFINSTTASDSNGTLQLIPPSFGEGYTAEVSCSTGIISGLDAEDYYIDYYSGILFIQDINRIPTAVTAYAYVGDYGAVTKETFNSLREIRTGTFDADGTKTIELQKFISSDLEYITLDVTTKLHGTNYYTNDLISIQISGNLNNKLSVQLSSPSYTNLDSYKVVAVKESA